MTLIDCGCAKIIPAWKREFINRSVVSAISLECVVFSSLQVGDLMRSMTLLAYKSMEGSLEEVIKILIIIIIIIIMMIIITTKIIITLLTNF